MGSYFAKSMNKTIKENESFIKELHDQKAERHVQIINQFREKEVALQIAKSRDIFLWFGAFYLTYTTWACYGYLMRRRKAFGVLVPLTFILAYQADMAYGTKPYRLIEEAENILQFEKDLLALPDGLPTLEDNKKKKATF